MTKKIAVVTGAGSGIGRAIAAELAARDHAVVVTDLDLAAAEATAKELARVGTPDVTALALDVSVFTVERVRERFVEQGLEAALVRKPQARPSRLPVLDGDEEQPFGRRRWTGHAPIA